MTPVSIGHIVSSHIPNEVRSRRDRSLCPEIDKLNRQIGPRP